MKYKTVIFDFDSTLVTIEGINELARIKNVYDQVHAMTEKAMNGNLTFPQVFYKRLKMIKPNHHDLAQISLLYLRHITPGAKELIKALTLQGVSVHIISGGYEQAIIETSTYLGIPPANVHTIRLAPDNSGSLTRVSNNKILVEDDGKAKLIHHLNLEKKIAFIGDGNTDASSRSYVDTFIGFGGIATRPSVQSVSDQYVSSSSLFSVYNFLQ